MTVESRRKILAIRKQMGNQGKVQEAEAELKTVEAALIKTQQNTFY